MYVLCYRLYFFTKKLLSFTHQYVGRNKPLRMYILPCSSKYFVLTALKLISSRLTNNLSYMHSSYIMSSTEHAKDTPRAGSGTNIWAETGLTMQPTHPGLGSGTGTLYCSLVAATRGGRRLHVPWGSLILRLRTSSSSSSATSAQPRGRRCRL